MPKIILLAVLFLSCLCVGPSAHAQTIDASEGPATPLDRNGRPLPSVSLLDQPAFAHIYVNLMKGQAIPLPNADTVDPAAHHYAGYDFVISVASRALYADTRESQRKDVAGLNELRRMNAHVRFDGLAADKVTVLTTSRHDPGVLVLHLTPSNVTMSQPTQPGAGETTARQAISSVTHFLGPIGGLVNTFMGARHHPASPSFFSYLRDDHEFGWNWYRSATETLEGIHRASALIQTRADVAFVRVTVDLVTDWSHQGGWAKTYTFLVAVPPAK